MSIAPLSLRCVAPVIAGLSLALPAWAMDLPASPTPVSQPTPIGLPATVTPVAVPVDLLGDPAWRLVRDAMADLAKGEQAGALGCLDELRQRFSGHPAVRVTEPAFAALDAPRHIGAGAVVSGPEGASKLARAELVSTQSLAGLSLGIAACVGFDCPSARTGVALNLLTVGAELGGSLYFSRDGITPGQATAVNSGTLWGLGHGLILQDLLVSDVVFVDKTGQGSAVAFDTFDDQRQARDRNKALTVIGSQLVGTGIGAAVAHYVHPKAGSVSLVNSAGLWSLASMGLFLNATNWKTTSSQFELSMMLASDLGMAGGVWAANNVEVSRSRVLIVDSAGLLGGLLGAGVYVLAVGDGGGDRALAGSVLAGVLTGLGAGIAMTQHWDLPEVAALPGQPMFMPVSGGAVVGWAGQL